MGLRAGLLRESVTILRPVVTRNDYGEEVTTWEQVTTTRCRVDFRSGTRAVQTDEVFGATTVVFTLRRFYTLDVYMRLQWHGRLYSIQSVNEDNAKQYITIVADMIND